jgi:hypothetical protein
MSDRMLQRFDQCPVRQHLAPVPGARHDRTSPHWLRPHNCRDGTISALAIVHVAQTRSFSVLRSDQRCAQLRLAVSSFSVRNPTRLPFTTVSPSSLIFFKLALSFLSPLGTSSGLASHLWRFAPTDTQAVRDALEPALLAGDATLNGTKRAQQIHIATHRVARRWPGVLRWTLAPTNHEYLVQCEELLDVLLDDTSRASYLPPRRSDSASVAQELPIVFRLTEAKVDDVDDLNDASTQSDQDDDTQASDVVIERHNRAPVEMERDLDALESIEDAFSVEFSNNGQSVSTEDEQVTALHSVRRMRVLPRSLVPPSPSDDDDDDENDDTVDNGDDDDDETVDDIHQSMRLAPPPSDDDDDDDSDDLPFKWKPIQLTKRRRM